MILAAVTLASVTQWWPNQDAGYIGAAVGIAGAIFGCTAGILGPRLRTPAQFRAMRLFFSAAIALGLACVAGAVFALASGQPYHVWYALALPGLLLTILPATLLIPFRARQRRIETLRLESESLRRA